MLEADQTSLLEPCRDGNVFSAAHKMHLLLCIRHMDMHRFGTCYRCNVVPVTHACSVHHCCAHTATMLVPHTTNLASHQKPGAKMD